MKNNWELSYQNLFLLALVVGLTVWILGARDELNKSEIRKYAIEQQMKVNDSLLTVSGLKYDSLILRYDSLTVRDSMVVTALASIKTYTFINDTTISNDSLRNLMRKRLRTK